MQLQTFIASALLLSGLAGAVNLPRANEATQCAKAGERCNIPKDRLCCKGSLCIAFPAARRGDDGVSVTIHVVFFLLLTQL